MDGRTKKKRYLDEDPDRYIVINVFNHIIDPDKTRAYIWTSDIGIGSGLWHWFDYETLGQKTIDSW